MKKILSIIVLGLLLSGCVNGTGNESMFSKKGKEKKEKVNEYPYGAYWTLLKKGFNKQGYEYGYTKDEAMANASKVCEIKKKEVGIGRCSIYGPCNSRGSNCDPSVARRAAKKANKSSSGSKIDPSVWDDIFNASQGVLSGKSVSESLGSTNSSSSSSSTTWSCTKKSESISGTNKICIYNCMGSDVAINVKSTKLCPISIRR